MNNEEKYLYPDLSWGVKKLLRPSLYSGYTVQSIYIPVRDGTRLAADIFLPENLPSATRLPALLYRTRYWRDVELSSPEAKNDSIIQHFTNHGFTVVRVDVRGTGASFGHVLHEWQPQDTLDAYDLIEWIIAQPWCNGKVGAFGGSYAGTTAVLLAETGHPSVTSIWGTCFEFDGYTDIIMPGGVPSKFIDLWGQYTTALDQNLAIGDDGKPDPLVKGVKPVDEDTDRALLKSAIKEHQQNNHADTLMENVMFRDDEMLPGIPAEAMAIYNRLEKLVASGVPMDIWGSWMDANTADTVIRMFVNNPHVHRGVIGAWSHSGIHFCSPYAPADAPHEMPFEIQLNEILQLMKQNFQPDETQKTKRGIYYYTMGEEKWKFTPTWPPENITIERWHLHSGRCLSQEKVSEPSLQTTYTIDFSATTGMQNRWWTELTGGRVSYSDRVKQDEKLLIFESAPLEIDLEITGYPMITLSITSTEKDGTIFVYLEDVDTNGEVIYLTEGMLRILHRNLSNNTSPYRQFVPYHSFCRKDGHLLKPGQITELKFALIPVSAMIHKGHRVRLAIAGADESTFKRIPETGQPEVTLFHNSYYPSWIDLPVIRR